MRNGGSKMTGNIDEIDEYFKHAVEADEREYAAVVPSQNNDDMHREEVRRLNALVAHLRDQVREIQSRSHSNDRARNGSGFPLISTVLFAAGLVSILLAVQTRNFRRK